jgi:aryl-alcohol dehydrogenase-like predicted oxidoreductase
VERAGRDMVPEGPGRDLGLAAVAWAEVAAARVLEEGRVSARVAEPAPAPVGPVAEAQAEACGSLAVGLVLAAVLAQGRVAGRAQEGQEVGEQVAAAAPARVPVAAVVPARVQVAVEQVAGAARAEEPGQVQALRAGG